MKQHTELDARAAELVTHFDAFVRRFAIRKHACGRDHVRLSRQEVRVIGSIGEKPAWTMGELARHLMLGPSSLTSILDRLVAKRMVKRERSERDRRAVWVRLTAQGRRQHARFRRRRFRVACGMLGALGPGEQEVFIGLMGKIGRGSAADNGARQGSGEGDGAARGRKGG